jgi:hypothetical protein
MGFEIKITDNFDAVLANLDDAIASANEAVGLAMEAHVVEDTPVGTPESTSIKNYHGGSLRKSITHKVIDNTVYVGTNMKAPNGAPYPVYVELGTGIYATDGKGRKSPWVWRDKNGKYHYTKGIRPTHFMRNALSRQDHIEEYKEIYEEQLKKG